MSHCECGSGSGFVGGGDAAALLDVAVYNSGLMTK